jgi:hypothetical protein
MMLRTYASGPSSISEEATCNFLLFIPGVTQEGVSNPTDPSIDSTDWSRFTELNDLPCRISSRIRSNFEISSRFFAAVVDWEVE